MIVYAALMPHPPIIIPEVGKDRLELAQPTVDGMNQLAREVARSRPETLVFITPHGNVFRDTLSVVMEEKSEGDLREFGYPEVKSVHPSDPELVQALLRETDSSGLELLGVNATLANKHALSTRLDHGVLVPLYYLERAGLKNTRVVAISIGYLAREELYCFGMCLARVSAALGRRVGLIASGDMSHRLKEGGPYDYHPDGPVFDETIRHLLQNRDVMGVLQVPASLAENAGECGYRSLLILMGALEGQEFTSQVFSYEGPFGVGYLTAGFVPTGASPTRELLPILRQSRQQELEEKRRQESTLVQWARRSLETYVREGARVSLPPELPVEMKTSAAAFVSLKKGGQLRGCIGTLLPVRDNLALEIRENAISAGTADYRFPSVNEHELPELVYSVDVLTWPEPVVDRRHLDPRRYGVIVRCGDRAGVLLPDLEGVDTVDEQIKIALQKAGIGVDEQYTIERFQVKRYY